MTYIKNLHIDKLKDEAGNVTQEGTTVTAAKLNNMEDGIEAAHELIDGLAAEVDGLAATLADGLTPESIVELVKGADGVGSGLDADKVHGADGSNLQLCFSGSSTYTDNDTSQTFTDERCTVNSRVFVYITSGAPAGTWTVDSADGSFTITSTAAESADITFEYDIMRRIS